MREPPHRHRLHRAGHRSRVRAQPRQLQALLRKPAMVPRELVPGLWRWTAPHPDRRPDAAPGSSADWDELVGSVLYELAGVAVLIDPLLPVSERHAFLNWLDERVAGRPVSVLTTVRWHRRDRDE